MLLLFGVLLVAIAIGYIVGGRLRNLGLVTLSWWPLAPLGLALQLLPLTTEGANPIGYIVLVSSYVLLAAFALRNILSMGFPIILIGLILNGIVVAVNHGMPVTESALRKSGQAALLQDLKDYGGTKHHLATSNDSLVFLSDAIPVGPPIKQVVSVGDVFVYTGLALTVAAAMRGQTRAREKAQRPAKSP